MEEELKLEQKLGRVYKIVCKTTGAVYFGSTTKTLKQRLAKHYSSYKQYLGDKCRHRTTSFTILANNNYQICLVENVLYTTIKELRERERFYIETEDCVNKFIPNRSCKEWHQIPEVRERENARRREREREKMKDPEVRKQRNEKQNERRKDPEVKQRRNERQRERRRKKKLQNNQ